MNEWILIGTSGGLSYLSDLYGLVCDNVVNFEVSLTGPILKFTD